MRLKRKTTNTLELANTVINSTKTMVWFILTIIAIFGVLLGLWGIATLNDIKNQYDNKILTKVNSIENEIQLINQLHDSLQIKYSDIKTLEKLITAEINVMMTNYTNAEKSLSSLTIKMDNYQNDITNITLKIDSIRDDIARINAELIVLSNVFNNVGAAHQNQLTVRERLLLYAAAYEIDIRSNSENPSDMTAFNYALMLRNIGEFKKALHILKSIEQTKLHGWSAENFDRILNVCEKNQNTKIEDIFPERKNDLQIFEDLFFILFERGYISKDDIDVLKKRYNK